MKLRLESVEAKDIQAVATPAEKDSYEDKERNEKEYADKMQKLEKEAEDIQVEQTKEQKIVESFRIDEYNPSDCALAAYQYIADHGLAVDFEELMKARFPQGVTSELINKTLCDDADWVFNTLGLNESYISLDDISSVYDLMEDLDEDICCICGEPFIGYGNNPYPVCDDGRCCDRCNFEKVIPARINASRKTKDTEALQKLVKKDSYKESMDLCNCDRCHRDFAADELKETAEGWLCESCLKECGLGQMMLNEGSEILAAKELEKALPEVMFIRPEKAKELMRNPKAEKLVKDYIESGMKDAEEYLQNEIDYYGENKFANWLLSGFMGNSPKEFKQATPFMKEAVEKHDVVLNRRKNEYGEYVVKDYINGKYNEDATYYTDDWEDAVGTFKDVCDRLGLKYKQKHTGYTTKEANESLNEANNNYCEEVMTLLDNLSRDQIIDFANQYGYSQKSFNEFENAVNKAFDKGSNCYNLYNDLSHYCDSNDIQIESLQEAKKDRTNKDKKNGYLVPPKPQKGVTGIMPNPCAPAAIDNFNKGFGSGSGEGGSGAGGGEGGGGFSGGEALEDSDNALIGKTIKIIKMDNGDSPVDDSRYNGRTGIVKYIDDMGQLHGTWGSLAVIPEVDEFEVID